MSVSHWHRALPADEFRADAVVVGAGICGIAAATALQRRGLHVEVLDRGSAGSGASSRNAGFLMRGAADNYAAAVRLFGRDRARLLWRWTEDNLADLRREGIDTLPSYRAVPSCLLAYDPGEAAELRESLALLREDGFAAEWLDQGDDAPWRSRALRPLGGLLNPGDAAINPVEMLRFLSSRLDRPVREGAEAAAIAAASGDAVRLLTTRGVFITPRLLICTNAYAGTLLPSLADAVTPRRGQMLALHHPGLRLDYSYYANHGYEYFRQAADGALVFGGCRKRFADTEVGCDDRPTAPVQRAIESFAAAVLDLDPSKLNITARWAGTMGFSPDGLPLIGPVSGDSPAGAVWFCGGFTGHGMSMAWRSAHAAVAAMLDGAPTPFPLARLHEEENSRSAGSAR